MITWFQFIWTHDLFLRSWTCKCKPFAFSHAQTLPTTWEWNNSAKMFCSFSETGGTWTCVYQIRLFSLFAERKSWLQFNFQATSSIRSQSYPEYRVSVCRLQPALTVSEHCDIASGLNQASFFYIMNSPLTTVYCVSVLGDKRNIKIFWKI